ncbi:vegetative incompatibility protein HET-E-1, putative [Rhizoctonia solani AG-3 Rhs1AP]|uniref:Vegetative incompatibility protein HET-E-1, putative n=1 Tax=Rhizoctonia solani AG-3 Rhs1AP TaxID=1086054 RepID=X8J261_9AGAM|nr:vegetative incompatibility protein HET-E-1, putative [Rhizoctonia solani AG-3 Rhs1AP]
MSSQSSGSKRKQTSRPNIGNLLHPGEWRNKRARSGSPPIPGTSTPGIGYSHSLTPSNPNSRSPSPMGHPGPSLTDHDSLNTSVQTSTVLTSITLQASGISNSAKSSTGSAWAGLEQALRALHVTTKICPPLASAVDKLTLCLPIFEAAAKNHRDYDELANGLKNMVHQLTRHLNGTVSEGIITTITGIAEAIRKEIESINMHQSRSLPRRMLGASDNEDDLIRRYRRIEQLFRQLQEQQLNDLHPAKLARFNSKLSTEVSRRGCTKDTRTKILEESIAWSENPDLAKVYWMNGMAGTGKTTIAYSLCERLETRKQLAASFFCTRASPECREAKHIIPTIAYQLARRFAPFRYSLCQQLKQDPDISTGQLSDQFDLLLKRPLLKAKDKLSNNLVIVIDALDECSDPHIVELFLDLLFRSVIELPVKFFVTSRPEPAIRNKMMPESERSRSILYLHEIELSLVQADIELYLREELGSIAPADEDITELAEHAGNLFIYAATAVRYIRPVGKAVNSKARLKVILAVSTESFTTLSAIDALYVTILTAAVDDEELSPDEKDQMRLVLQTAICACEPIPIHTLSVLSGLDDTDDVVAALQPLRSVLHVSEQSELVTTLHASFPDFMFSQARSGAFYCNKAAHNQLLAERCLNIMKAQLRFNICSIESSFIPNGRIPELGERVKRNISDELFYTCRFWVDHLSETNSPDTLLLQAHEFLCQRLLFWMEVMSIKKSVVTGIISLTKLNAWLSKMHRDTHTNILELASDAQGFVAGYALSPASAYAPHIYLSALPLSPPSSSVRFQYLPWFKGLIKVSGTIFARMEKASLGVWASTSSIRSATFLPNDGRIVLGDDEGRIFMQNAYDGKYIVQPFKAHKKVVTSLAVSSDDTQIVSGSNDRNLFIWNARDGSYISGPFKGHNNRVTSVAFSPDAAMIASGSDDRSVRIWNPHDVAMPARIFKGHKKEVKSVAFSPDGSRVISGSADHTIRLWDLSSGATIITLQGHTSAVSSVQFSPDGAHIISGSNDCSIRIWNTSDGSLFCQPPTKHSKRITSIAISPDGDRFVSGSLDCTIRIWDTHSGGLIAGPFEGHTGSVRSVGFSGDGVRIMSASDDATVRVWNAKDQGAQRDRDPRTIYGRSEISASCSQTHVAICDQAEPKPTKIHVWALRTIAHVVIPTNAEIRHLQFSLDGTRIYSLHASNAIYTWNAQTAELLDGPYCFTTLEKWDSVVCSADGTRVVTCCGNEAELWHVKPNHRIALRGTYSYWTKVIFTPDGSRFVAYNAGRRTSEVWDGASGARVAGPFPVEVLGLSPDGTHLCCWSRGGSIQLIHAETGGEIDIPQKYCPSSAMFTPDGLYVAKKQSDHTIGIWDTSGQAVASFNTGHGGFRDPELLGFSSDGWLLLSANHYGEGGGFYVWRIHIDCRPFGITSDGWIIDSQRRPMIWVPTEIRRSFSRYNGVIVSDRDEVSLSVDYSDMLVGDDWSQCYSPSSQSTSDVVT